MSPKTFRLKGLDWPVRRAMLTRLGCLIIAGNIRTLHAEPNAAQWSAYQYSVACASLGIETIQLHMDEHPVVDNQHGTWEEELCVVLEGITDALDEFTGTDETGDDNAEA